MVLRTSGRCYQILRNYQTSRWIASSVVIRSCQKINNGVLRYKQHTHRSAITKDLSGKDVVFLVVAGAFIEDSTFMLEKVKSLQQRYSSLNVIGFQHCRAFSSDVVRSRLAKIIMSEYITFPILVSNKSLSEISDRVGYILFKGMDGSLLLHEKDVEFEIIEKAIKDLLVQPLEKPGLLHTLRGTWVKPLDAFKQPYLCSPLQNLLLYFPGCIEVDEVNERLFLSDINHHRIIVFDGNGNILDSIGSSPGFEDGEFESSKIMRPAALFYHDSESCLYFVDSENHAIRRADMDSRTVETLYPKPVGNKTKGGLLNWIINKLWNTKAVSSNSDEVDSSLLFYPWHLHKSLENDLFILNRSFETLWIMDLSSGLIKEVVLGSAKILEMCGPLILEKTSLLKEIPSNNLPQNIVNKFSMEGNSYAGVVSSVATFQDNIIICDSDGQVVLKYNKKSKSLSSFDFSNFGVLGLPYWLVSPMESVFAAGFGVSGVHVDHIQHFTLLPGRIDIKIDVEIPEDTELVEPLNEGCIWRQTRGTATETLVAKNKAESTEKIGVAQQWYDELDDLASLTEKELNSKEDTTSDAKLQDGKISIDCAISTSPGTSEVIINAALYLRIQNKTNNSKMQQLTRLVHNSNPSSQNSFQTEACARILSTSNKTPEEFVFLRPLHVRLKINSRDHPKAENSKDIILTESFIEVNVSLK
ncbi:hypothetical protein R6Q57_028622 [Mikania cordata]